MLSAKILRSNHTNERERDSTFFIECAPHICGGQSQQRRRRADAQSGKKRRAAAASAILCVEAEAEIVALVVEEGAPHLLLLLFSPPSPPRRRLRRDPARVAPDRRPFASAPSPDSRDASARCARDPSPRVGGRQIQ